jgi:hypothetical protein
MITTMKGRIFAGALSVLLLTAGGACKRKQERPLTPPGQQHGGATTPGTERTPSTTPPTTTPPTQKQPSGPTGMTNEPSGGTTSPESERQPVKGASKHDASMGGHDAGH